MTTLSAIDQTIADLEEQIKIHRSDGLRALILAGVFGIVILAFGYYL